MQKLTPESARDFLASDFWREWQELTDAATFQAWKDAESPGDQEKLRGQIDHITIAEEALIRYSCSDMKINKPAIVRAK